MKLNENTKKYIKFIFIFILFFLYPLIELIPIYIFKSSLNLDSRVTNIILTLFAEIIFAGIIFLVYFDDIKVSFKDFKNNALKYMDTGFKYWIAGVGVMAISNLIINLFSSSGIANNEEGVQAIIESVPIVAFFMTTILAPFIEEMVFRKAFKDVIHHKLLFILLSGFVFGGLHVVSSFSSIYDLLYIIPYSSLGIAFAYCYFETNNIFTTIVYHLIHNGALTILSLLAFGTLL